MSKKQTSTKASSTLDGELILDATTEQTLPNKPVTSLKEYAKSAPFSFDKKNYRILLIGLAVNILGFLLMIGGEASKPTEFLKDELFSHTRITIAPMLIVLGYVIIFYSIMRRPKQEA